MDWLLPVRALDDEGGAFEVTPHSDLLATYGSFLMACAVRAAGATTEGMVLTALQANFLSPPPPGAVRFTVERTRTGRSVAVRRVVAGDVDRPSAVMTLSYATPASDATQWQPPRADVADEPDSLEPMKETAAGIALLDLRPVGGNDTGFVRRHPFWSRPAQPFGDGDVAGAAAIALATDHFVIAFATPPHEGAPGPAVTLDHSVWIHRRTHADDWLRYDAELIAAEDGRALISGTVVDTEGRLVATYMQQALRRRR